MNELKQGDKLWMQVEIERIEPDGVIIKRGTTYWCTPHSSIHCDHTAELERLRAYVELQPCECLHVAASCMGTECDRCRALGKEKS